MTANRGIPNPTKRILIPNTCVQQMVSGKSRAGTATNDLWRVVDLHKNVDTHVTIENVDSMKIDELYLSKYTYVDFSKTDEGANQRQDILILKKKGDQIVRIDKTVNSGFQGRSLARVYPYYFQKEDLPVSNSIQMELVVKEITSEDELRMVRELSRFHYLGKENLWGRKHYILMRFKNKDQNPQLLGYIFLTSPSLLSRQRDKLLGWTSKEQRQANINRVVRIARVVVHPEFRGIGLGRLLVRHAIRYCEIHWNVVGLKPWLIETVAEMSRYHPIFEKAGMYPFGETEGTTEIVYKPVDELISGQGKGYYRASIDRIKSQLKGPKPYHFYPLHTKLVERLSRATKHDGPPAPAKRVRELDIRIHNLAVEYQRRNAWQEPLDVYHEWAQHNEIAARKYMDFKEFLSKLLDTIQSHNSPQDKLGLLKTISKPTRARLAKELEKVETNVQNMHDLVSFPFSESNNLISSVEDEIDNYERQMQKAINAQSEVLESLTKAIRLTESAVRRKGDSKETRAISMIRHQLLNTQRIYELGSISKKESSVQSAFGVGPDSRTTVLKDFNLDIPSGSIVLVVGPSGSGKSTLLNVLSGKLPEYKGSILPANLARRVGVLDLQFDGSKSIIDLLKEDTRGSLHLLNVVGLSEAALYLKRRDELSHGQRYRAATAILIDKGKSVWVADEFCAFLDPLTTIVISKGIRKLAKEFGATLIVAVSNKDYVLEGLGPDIVIHMNAGGSVRPNPKYVFWGKKLTLRSILKELRHIEKHNRFRDKGIARVLRILGIIKPLMSLSEKLLWSLTEDGGHILNEEANGERLSRLLWEKDMVFHRMTTVWERLSQNAEIEEIRRKTNLKNSPWSNRATITEIRRRIPLLEILPKLSTMCSK